MTDGENYNGWSNRETWAFWLHVTNDQGWYEMVREFVASEAERFACYARGTNPDVTQSDRQLGEAVVEYVTDTLTEMEESHLPPERNYWGGETESRRIREAVSQLRMMRDEIGSWWRIDHAEIGAAARELVADQ
jgi:hypothetical protein